VSVFSFVLAENAHALVEAEFTFLQTLLSLLKPSAGILILDCTFKYFPLIEGMAESQGWETKRPAWPLDINGHCKSVLFLSRPCVQRPLGRSEREREGKRGTLRSERDRERGRETDVISEVERERDADGGGVCERGRDSDQTRGFIGSGTSIRSQSPAATI
jgi:hypothetical protein